MQDLRSIKQRMGSTRNILKIADAMKMVSTVKYWRLQEALRRARAIGEEVAVFIPPGPRVEDDDGDGGQPHMEPGIDVTGDPPAGRTLVLVFFPHRGMCGPLTQNLSHAVAGWYPTPGEACFAVFGRKGASTLPEERFPRVEGAPELSTEGLDETSISSLTRFIAEGVSEGRFTRVEAVTAEFRNLLRQSPMRLQLFPLPEATGENPCVDTELEPDADTLLRLFLPIYMECLLRRLVLECMVSEHASRMTAMDSASKNAQELLEQFRLEYNKIRQSKITLELMEIISGSEALQ
jgi:F-type H+-transporting ATPase subunit gamma